jgi:HD-GYP domain-containing protein (c-di-GMP phosphodiesterase class II)
MEPSTTTPPVGPSSQRASGLPTHEATPAKGRSLSLLEKAKALAVLLPDEFGAPFVFFDAAEGKEIWRSGRKEASSSGTWEVRSPLLELSADEIRRRAAEGQGGVEPVADHCYRLTLVLVEGDRPGLFAVAIVVGVGGGDREREARRLHKWLRAVADRLRLSEELANRRRSEEEQAAQVQRAWEVVLGLDHAIRHLRFHKDPEKTRRTVLQTALALVGAEALVWVPEQAGAPAHVQGEACLAAADCRGLAALLARHGAQPGKPLTWNQDQAALWSASFPRINNLLAFSVADGHQTGWLVALNKKGDGNTAPFRRADAAVLMPFAALLELHGRGARRFLELKELLVGLTRSLTSALDAKDSYTYGHSERVARIAVELGRELKLPEGEISDIYLAGLLHDVGKIGVRDEVLLKPDRLTAEEYEHLKQHVTIGYAILSDLRPIRHLLPGVLYHHERWDGKGYPDGLAGEAIPLLARILAVADAYDAMSTRRPYREAMPVSQVEDTLRRGAASQWDARVVEAFVHCRERIHVIRQRGVGESLCHALDGALRDAESLLSLGGRLTPLP